MTFRKIFVLAIALLLETSILSAQQSFSLVNDASVYSGCNCYQLTAAANNQGGGVYQDSTINLLSPFDYTFSIYLGDNTGGADGIVFILSNNINQIGATGGGLGYGALPGNSIGIEYDTYQNGWDPPYNHIAIEKDGMVQHPTGTIAGPVAALPSQAFIDDGAWHTTRIIWDPVALTYTVYFDGNLRLTYTGDIVNNFLNGNPIVNWGWSGGTGALNNAQRICTNAISGWNAGINYQSCNRTVPFQDISTSNIGNVNNWSWNFGDTASHAMDTSSLQNPTHTFTHPGTYVVMLVVTDITSCPDTFTHNFVVDSPISISPTYIEPKCNGGSNGSIILATSGGLGMAGSSYSYTWSNTTSSSILSGVHSGSYLVTVTDGICTTTASYILNEPLPLSVAFTDVVNDSCFGYCDGKLIAAGGGGIVGTGYTYHWSNNTTGATDSLLCAMAYTVTVTDSNACTATAIHSITSPPSNITLSLDSVNVKCFGQPTGQASVVASGGTPGYTYLWNNNSTTATIISLIAGPYTVTVKDNSGCGVVGMVHVAQPASALAIQLRVDSITCKGLSNGKAFVTASGGTPAYTYLWGGSQSADSITGLSAGTYTIMVTDTQGCIISGSTTIAPSTDTVIITATEKPATCGLSNGSITALASGGSGTYVYSWSPVGSTATISALTVGTYMVTVTDGSGCTGARSVSIRQYPSLVATVYAVSDTCGQDKGNISVTVDSGTPPYIYVWTPSGIDTSKLMEGSYAVTITDSTGCSFTKTVTIGNDSSDCTSMLVFGNAFTPNGDGKNETFGPRYSPDLDKFQMRIYNSWGQLIFETYDATQGWDGSYKSQPQMVGTFIWFADYSFTKKAGTISQTGSFSLFR